MNTSTSGWTTCRARCLLLLLVSFVFCVSVYAQSDEVSGTVKDNNGEPLVGVTVLVKGTKSGATTDLNGHYSLMTKNPQSTLVFTYIGYQSQEVPINGKHVIDAVLKDGTTDLNDVVVIGYGKTTKKEVTGSVVNLKRADFNQGSFTNAAGLLQGKVAGLTITNPGGGDPNASYEILLRGTNTLSAGQGPLIIIDGVVGADIRNINFQEVESIDVLKDGSAAAIYGTRGTNGVIIITTKRATAGATRVEYDGQLSAQTVARRAVPLTADQFRYVVTNFMPARVGNIYGASTDWFDEITRSFPISQKHSLAFSGGSDKFSHRTVLNFEQNQGLQLKNNSNKFLFKSNIHQNSLGGWLTFDYNANFSKRVYNPANYSAFEQAFYHNPTEPVYDATNVESGGYQRISEMGYFNPVAMINEQNAENTADDYGVNGRATLNVLKIQGLKWDNFLAYNQQNYESRVYQTQYYPSAIGQGGVASISNERSADIQYESIVNYSKNIDKHAFQSVVGYAYQKGFNQSYSLSNYGFDSDDWLTNNIGAGTALGKGMASMGSYKESNTYIAFFGRVMYNYDEKYLTSVSLRRDGSSRFGSSNKWGWFPALSLGWRINREEFMQDVDWVDELKLRAGYGETGNQDFANYKSLMLMKTNGMFYYNGEWINAYAPASNANPDLAWEKKAEWNAGLDFTLLNKRLSGTLDYYLRNTTNLLYTYSVPTPPYVYDELFTNVGQIRNTGVELTINAIPVQLKDFRWNTTLTFSHNSNKLIKFTNSEFTNGVYKVGWLNSPIAAYSQRLIEGQSLGSFYGPVWLGTDKDGKDIYKNAIGGNVAESSWEKIGCAYPDLMAGLTNTFNYKNWDLNVSLRASIGGKVFNTYAAQYDNLTNLGLKNILSSWLDHTNYTGGVKYSSKYLEDATYLKMDNITLGYNLKFNSTVIQKARFYFSAQNVFCLTGYSGVDPEVSLSGLAPGIESTSYYPRTTMGTIGLSLTFN
ncbi:MAG: SusC/RagA family TonB-linked outer membrane protein [Bacteroidota bacterium]|nr:SusC/RagA family TonB-linked outer membrane protein [Bacteroidota bacterium]